ncbi:UNVERIFIED_CONTAM: Alpha-glucan water dikinase, chloroplastic [Sesamum radiatum]|uniref:alpha-glucan, water dikinase n=1 Tax=Sesamum radiatum TaxID=300843 RepID=A0AAW2TYL1_SESRA
MSNSIGNNFLHQSLLSPTVLEHQGRINSSSCAGGNTLFQPQANSLTNKSCLSTAFRGNRLRIQKNKLLMGKQRAVSRWPQAVLAADVSAEVVDVRPPTSGSGSLVNIVVTSSSDSLLLHWGAIKGQKDNWILPQRRPVGSMVYKNKALRSPFKKSGSNAILSIEIEDPGVQALEFLIFDEAQNKWYKKSGGNFHVKLPVRESRTPNVSVPEDLVQIQAYLRWEKKGKQIYTPKQEEEEYEAARMDLLEEIARETIEEARKELQFELEKGASTDEIQKRITKGKIETKVAKQAGRKSYSTVERIQRKKRDVMQLLSRFTSRPVEENISSEPEVLSEIQQYERAIEDHIDGPIVKKQTYKLADKKLMVLVAKPSGMTKVYLATDLPEPVVLHWALSKRPGEWVAPPSNALSPDSVSFDNAVETKFVASSFNDQSYKVQSLEITIEDDGFVGMPFVLLSGGKWVKNKGSDFYVEFNPESVVVVQKKETLDAKGTPKVLLDKIAELESEAQKSFMHRFNIAADLMEQATSAGELGLAAILVWMRYMATRQLIWNKNYNVKPREISKAQDMLIDLVQNVYRSHPHYREILRMIMSTVGRGGDGDVGQRIRDEILVIQRKNDCKGGMMEEWHQKLHNNTSPDDVVICQAVHSGADLESAVANCMGYKDEGEGFMVGVHINPISGLPSGFQELIRYVLLHIEDKNVEALLEGLLEAREELRPSINQPKDRLKDLIFLDIALDSTVRTTVERGYEELSNASPEKIMYFISLVVENLALSVDNNEDLICCLKGWNLALSMLKNGYDHWALFAKSVLDRTRLACKQGRVIPPTNATICWDCFKSTIYVHFKQVNIFTEEMIRAGSAASLSSLLNRLDPFFGNCTSRKVISPVEAIGYVVVVDELLSVQNKSYSEPTILVAKSVKGEEEIPDCAVAVCFATCFDYNILGEIQANEGKLLHLKPTSADVAYSTMSEDELATATDSKEVSAAPSVTLVRKEFSGRYAISSEEFTSEMVGAKSRNIAHLKGKVPSWVHIPTSVALPFGVFETVLSDDLNQVVADKLQILKRKLDEGDFSVLGEIRSTVLELSAPPQLVKELKEKMQRSGMPWPGDEGSQRWEQAWTAIKKVWASKWNERAYFSTRKVRLDHDYLCMAVLVQEIINADYAFVIHTTNPSSGDSSEIYAEVVMGLGETLVGAYLGRALSFICKKNDLDAPQVLGYPSKPVGLFIRPSIIFRSDSNGEDLEGYAGAGLYDSVPMDEEEKVIVDYSSDPLIVDGNFRRSILSSIARAGSAIEDLYGSAQDIEGVVKDGKIYVVQTRPQM